jgi:hypothetical protein
VKTRLRLKLLVVLAVLVSLSGFWLVGARIGVDASAFGPSASHTDAPGENNCTSCHADSPVNSGGGSIQVAGLPAGYTPGQSVQITVTVTQENAVIYGFQLTAVDGQGRAAGTFSVPQQNPQQMQVISGNVSGNDRLYVEHTVDGVIPANFGSKSWTFTWNAPAVSVGPVSFFAAGNAANSDGSTSGDFIYTTSRTIDAAAAASVSIGGRVAGPNGTVVRNATVLLTGAAGTRTTLTNSFGFYVFQEVAPGQTYSLRASSKRYRFSSRQITPTTNLSDVDFTGIE